MNQTGSLKENWDEQKKARFEKTLLSNGWEVHQTLKKSTIFQKQAARIEVDDFGAFLFLFQIPPGESGRFVRTNGISDDLIDRNYSPGFDPNVLLFRHKGHLKRFNLETGEWAKK